MFDTSVIKEMKLSELQEIAKASKKIKWAGVKKDELIYKILDFQAANPESDSGDEKPGRGRRKRLGNETADAAATPTLFPKSEEGENQPKKEEQPKQKRRGRPPKNAV